jgi:hypothetical protein
MIRSKEIPFFTADYAKWPIVVVKFNRDLRKERHGEEEDLKTWIGLMSENIEISKEKRSKFIVIYDHTIFNYPSATFRLRTMNFVKDNFDVMDECVALTVMVMPALMTRMLLKAANTISKIPGTMKIVADIVQAEAEAAKYLAGNDMGLKLSNLQKSVSLA